MSISGAGAADGPPLTRDNLLFLQRTAGNRAVGRLLQRKAKLSQPGDAYEREADRVAEQVVQMPAPSLSRKAAPAGHASAVKIGRIGSSQVGEMRRAESVEEEERKRREEEAAVQAKPVGGGGYVQRQATSPEDEKRKRGEEAAIQAKEEAGRAPAHEAESESQINHIQEGGGEPLGESARAYYEPRFGQDFGDVRIHKGSQAAEAARAVNARAYTTGSDVVFGANEYAPETDQGKRLLAHELTHVVQQGGASQVQSDGGERAQRQIQMKANDVRVSTLNVSATPVLQRNGGQSNLARLDEMLDQFDVPEESVITLCGQLNDAEKTIVLAGGYRSRMASALNVGEMVRAVNNLGPALSTKLEWVKEASLFTSSIDYSDISAMVRSAQQGERDALKTNSWRDFFVDVCTNATMVTALNDLGFDLQTKLRWLQAEMTVTSAELSYSTIQPWITGASQTDRDALKTDEWKGFFVAVCDNTTMVTALNDLGFDLQTKLRWLQAEMTITSWELSYSTIKPWIAAASQGDRDALRTDEWKGFFVAVCDNATMEEALNDLNFDMETQVKWMIAESDAETVLNTTTFMTRVRSAPNFTDLMKILVDVSALPAGVIQDATAQLAGSTEEIDRNTAKRIIGGSVKPYYIEDLAQPSNVNAVVTAAGLDPAAFTVYLAPDDNTKRLFQQLNAQGFTNANAPGYIFGLRSLPVARWTTILTHETSHAVNADESSRDNSIERYKGEFRAYWVVEYRGVADLDVRAQQIKQHILNSYPRIRARYDSEAAFKAQVDAHTRPEGNLTNE